VRKISFCGRLLVRCCLVVREVLLFCCVVQRLLFSIFFVLFFFGAPGRSGFTFLDLILLDFIMASGDSFGVRFTGKN
jgi:hypothetical protein